MSSSLNVIVQEMGGLRRELLFMTDLWTTFNHQDHVDHSTKFGDNVYVLCSLCGVVLFYARKEKVKMGVSAPIPQPRPRPTMTTELFPCPHVRVFAWAGDNEFKHLPCLPGLPCKQLKQRKIFIWKLRVVNQTLQVTFMIPT